MIEYININVNKEILVKTPAVACIGYFDGIHLGHQKLIKKVLERAKTTNLKPSCICFDLDPWIMMNKSKDVNYITPFNKRIKVLTSLGIERFYILHFDEKMRSLSVEAFIKLLEKMNVKELVCGDDFRFAYKGEGNINDLRKSNLLLHVQSFVSFDDIKISSSIIERLLKEGNIKEANRHLGYTYNIEGKVVHGFGIGKKHLSYPTVNITLNDTYIIPKTGVYAGYISVNNQIHKVMINVGYNPTISNLDTISIEAHILDFNEDLYEQEIVLYFSEYIRDEMKFENKQSLIEQLNKDYLTVKKWEGEIRCV